MLPIAVAGPKFSYETPSYYNYGGRGDRTGSITLTASSSVWPNQANLGFLINGVVDNGIYPANAQPIAGTYIRFSTSSKIIITEITIYFDTTLANCGEWQWQGSDDGNSWTNSGASFVISGTAGANIFNAMSAETTGYKYHQLLGVSGNSSYDAYWQEILFKAASKQ